MCDVFLRSSLVPSPGTKLLHSMEDISVIFVKCSVQTPMKYTVNMQSFYCTQECRMMSL